ncbi:MAG: hypothetical protein RLZZ459_189 [Cyanobacteriota bacterium]|jgi:4-amino-4-deoxychorismate lyase
MSSGGIAWLAGRWGEATELAIPLQDRGLRLADGLFETVLVWAGQPRLLAEHLQRWRDGAALLGMAAPPDRAWLEPLITEAIERAGLTGGHGALRLNWSRGMAGGRGIDLAAAADEPAAHRFWLQLSACTPTFSPQTTWISRQERRNADSLLSRCKTFAYGQAIQARREARAAGADEALLLSSGGGLCCGAVANLLVRRADRWLTPPLRSGCLPGVMRGRALALGLAVEADLTAAQTEIPPEESEAHCLLLNSLGCRPVSAIDGRPRPHLSAAEAEAFWRRLL